MVRMSSVVESLDLICASHHLTRFTPIVESLQPGPQFCPASSAKATISSCVKVPGVMHRVPFLETPVPAEVCGS